jgi:hypothetical protein
MFRFLCIFGLALTLVAVQAVADPTNAAAEPSVQVLAIGNNRAFAGAVSDGGAERLELLKFADDDAAAVFEFLMATAERGHLLTVMDAETQALYPQLVASARVPSMAELDAAVAAIGAEVRRKKEAKQRTTVFVFFSGHGSRSSDGLPALALHDAGITHDVLYERVLAKIPADIVHLLIDSCYAEAVVRPRDVDARPVAVEPAEADALLVNSTLARFPNVGAIVASSTDARTHEWDRIRHGVFTHELLSALRGAADVNRDHRIEYSETYAFMAAANRSIVDARARLSVVARPPEVDRRVPLVSLASFPARKSSWLRRVPSRAGLVRIEDVAGRLLATLRPELGFEADLWLPSETTVFVRANDREAKFTTSPGGAVAFNQLAFGEPETRVRGSLESAMRSGLFATEFGRGYYLGFIDQSPGFAPVTFAEPSERPVAPAAAPVAQSRGDIRALLGAGLSRSVSDASILLPGLRVGLRPTKGVGVLAGLDLLRGQSDSLIEWQAAGTVGLAWSVRADALRGWLGAYAGGGLLAQSIDNAEQRISGVMVAGPLLGASLDVARTFDVWIESQASLAAFRQNGQTELTLLPSAFVGGALEF